VVERVLDVSIVVIGLLVVLPFMKVPALVIDAGTTFGVLILVALIGLWIVVKFRDFSDRILQAILARLKFLPAQAVMARWHELVDGLAPLTRFKSGTRVVFWTIVSWFFSWGIYWFVMRAYQPDNTVVEALFMVVALALAITVPSSPGFIGVFQYVGQQALVLPFGGKYNPSNALAITLVAYLVYYLFTSGLGVAGLWQVGQSFTNLGKLITARQGQKNPAS
jgi:uncharacterized membrane protein YbhN (UPF0104 family)